MPGADSKIWGIAATVGLLMLAVALVVLGAAYGPATRYLSPSRAAQVSAGREVYVGGFVATAIKPKGKPPVFILADSASTQLPATSRTVRVEYTGARPVLLDEGQKAVFVGTVKRPGLILAKRLVDIPSPSASLGH